jgi:hypothetical protein
VAWADELQAAAGTCRAARGVPLPPLVGGPISGDQLHGSSALSINVSLGLDRLQLTLAFIRISNGGGTNLVLLAFSRRSIDFLPRGTVVIERSRSWTAATGRKLETTAPQSLALDGRCEKRLHLGKALRHDVVMRGLPGGDGRIR